MKAIISLLFVLAACTTHDAAPVDEEGQPYRCLVLYRCGYDPIVAREWLACAYDLDDAQQRSTDAGFEAMHEDCPDVGRWVRVECEADTPVVSCAP